jgi:long-subunit fatty acid transport protein
MTIQPTAAYRLDDHWSLGAGLTANYGYFKLEREPLNGDTRSQDDGDWDFGARLGVLYEPTQVTRLGLTWVSEAEYEFDVNGTVTIDPDGPLGLIGSITHTIPMAAGITAPQQVMGSAYHRLNDRWAMMGNLGWQDWSEFAEATLETDNLGDHRMLLRIPGMRRWYPAHSMNRPGSMQAPLRYPHVRRPVAKLDCHSERRNLAPGCRYAIRVVTPV